MRNLCLDEGILQSYYDGELEAEALEQVALHLASCEGCLLLSQTVESEMELTTSAFAAELSLGVPTASLRARLDDAIAELQPAAAFEFEKAAPVTGFRAWLSRLTGSFQFMPQRALGFASLAVFFILAAVIGTNVMRQRGAEPGMVAVNTTQGELKDFDFIGLETSEPDVVPTVDTGTIKRQATLAKKTGATAGAATPGEDIIIPPTAPVTVLPGEKNYLQAINELTEAIEANGETSLQPTLLADYKRNLAVVDQAINASQRTARTNPKSADAAEMLFAAYQSKLDLLSAVAEHSRPLIAER